MRLTFLATLLTMVPLALLIPLAFRAIRNPRAAAAGFGLPLGPDTDVSFVRVYGSRNLSIAVASLVLLAAGHHQALAILLTCAAPLTLFDMALLRQGGSARPPYGRHLVALVLLTTSAALWWFKA